MKLNMVPLIQVLIFKDAASVIDETLVLNTLQFHYLDIILLDLFQIWPI